MLAEAAGPNQRAAKKMRPGRSLVLTAEVKYSSRKITLKTARDGEKNMIHDSVNIFFKLLLKNVFKILHFGTNYSHRIVHMYFFYK